MKFASPRPALRLTPPVPPAVPRVAPALLFAAAVLTGPIVTAAPAPADAVGAPNGAVTEPAVREAPGFDAVVERIRTAAASGEWKRPGWQDPALAGGLSDLVERTKRESGRDDLALPVKFAEVAAFDANAAGARPADHLAPNTLRVGEDVNVTRGARSIILAGGNVEVAFAEGCVIVAGGAVRVAHGKSNVIVAGHYVHVSHDGNHAFGRGGPGPAVGRRAGDGPQGSVLVCGGVVDVSHATGTICSAPTLVQVAHARHVTFLNAPNVQVSHQQDSKQVQVDKLPLAPTEKPNPIAGKIKITQLMAEGGPRKAAVLDHGGVEVVVRPGGEIRDGAGNPPPGLEGWKLSFVGDEFALFSNGRDYAGFVVPRRN